MESEEEDYYLDCGSDMAEDEEDGSYMAEDEEDDSYMPEEEGDGSRDYKPDYKILKEEDIKHLLENDISTVCGVFSVSKGVACAILSRNNWNLDDWFAAADDGERKADPTVKSAIEQLVCKICYEKTRPEKMASAACGHPFCEVCWKTYIATAVSDGADCLMQHCPEPGCREAVTLDMVERLSSEAVFNKYHRYLLRSYVESNRKRKWCPAVGCDRAVEFDSESESYVVVCDCKYKFCWNCTEEHHRPVACKTVAEWSEKNRSEAENTTWILVNTKPCPKCKRPIEKNQGCNHMTCSDPCRFHFCWICVRAWSGHSDYYSCNQYKEEEKEKDERSKKMAERFMVKKMAERFMVKYTHYYERWFSNDKSRKIAMDDLDKARKKYKGQVSLEFVIKAWEQIVECRRVLKWSYVYGYYLLEEEGTKKVLFKDLQGQAEGALERLHHCVEKEIIIDGERFNFDSELCAKVLNLTKANSNFFQNLVIALESNLPEVKSSE